MNVIWYLSDIHACGTVRADVPARALNDLPDMNVVVKEKLSLSDLGFADVAVVQRGCCGQRLLDMNKLACSGIPVVYDIDDNLLEVPPFFTDAYEYFCKPESREALTQCMTSAQLVTVSSAYLGDSICSSSGVNILTRVVSNCVDLGHADLTSTVRKDDRFIIMWHGAAIHIHDVHLAAPAIAAVMKDHPHVEFWSYGSMEKKHYEVFFPDDLMDRVTVNGWVAPEDLYRVVSLADVAVAPLDSHEFNMCKSPIKWMEYAAVGVPTIVQNAFPYAELPDWVGRADDVDSLQAMLDQHIQGKRVGEGARCRKHCKEWYSSPVVARVWEGVLKDALVL